MKHIPPNYLARVGVVTLWHAPVEPSHHLDALAESTGLARSTVSELLAFDPTRPLHVCMCNSHDVMQEALGRSVPPTMLMAPYLGDDASLIVCGSPSIAPRNGDAGRMFRHLAHEIVHAFVAEVSGSVKELGDCNVGRRVPAWLDEGLAELVSLTVSGRDPKDLLEVPEAVAGWTESDVNERLDALDSGERELAFAWALGRVQAMTRDVGIAGLFASLRGST